MSVCNSNPLIVFLQIQYISRSLIVTCNWLLQASSTGLISSFHHLHAEPIFTKTVFISAVDWRQRRWSPLIAQVPAIWWPTTTMQSPLTDNWTPWYHCRDTIAPETTMHNASVVQHEMVNRALFDTKNMCISQTRRANQVPGDLLGGSNMLKHKQKHISVIFRSSNRRTKQYLTSVCSHCCFRHNYCWKQALRWSRLSIKEILGLWAMHYRYNACPGITILQAVW